jgi:circadian clock protein KaiC
MGFDLYPAIKNNLLRIVTHRPIDLSPEEVLHRIHNEATEIKARRVVIDSLNGFELALAPHFRAEFREALYRLTTGLTGGGVSLVFTVEIAESFTNLTFSPHAISFLTQNILFLRYVEIDGELRRMLAVIKMRRSAHSHALREYVISDSGIVLGASLKAFQGVLTGTPSAKGPR